MIEKVNIRGIEILAVKNEKEFVHFLMNEKEIKTGKLVAINAEKVIAAEGDTVDAHEEELRGKGILFAALK